jgi:hypothetical protein
MALGRGTTPRLSRRALGTGYNRVRGRRPRELISHPYPLFFWSPASPHPGSETSAACMWWHRLHQPRSCKCMRVRDSFGANRTRHNAQTFAACPRYTGSNRVRGRGRLWRNGRVCSSPTRIPCFSGHPPHLTRETSAACMWWHRLHQPRSCKCMRVRAVCGAPQRAPTALALSTARTSGRGVRRTQLFCLAGQKWATHPHSGSSRRIVALTLTVRVGTEGQQRERNVYAGLSPRERVCLGWRA